MRFAVLKNSGDTTFSTRGDFEVWNFTNDSASSGYPVKSFKVGRIKLFAQKGSLPLKKGLYTLSFDSLKFDTEEKALMINRINVVSAYGPYAMPDHNGGVETDWYNMQLDSFSLTGINTGRLFTDTSFVAKSGEIGYYNGDILRDKRPPFPEKPDTKLPSDMLASIPFGLQIDTLLVDLADIKYRERRKNTDEPGMVSFNELHATFTDLGNIDSLKSGPTKLHARAEVMDAATLNADFEFQPPGSSQPSTASGTLEPVDITTFNPMLIPNAAVKVTSGHVKQLAFNFGYNNDKSSGDMIFQYENLEFQILNRDENSERKLISLLADAFIVHDENLKSQDSYEKGVISFERDKKKSIFNYWWKSLLSGLENVAATIK